MMDTAKEMKSKYRVLVHDDESKQVIDKLASDWAQETTELSLNGNVLNVTHVFEDGSSLSSLEVEEL
jgi:hypothetical protein